MQENKIYLNSLDKKKYIACLMYSGIAKYNDKGYQKVLINKYIDDIAKSFVGSPVVEGHNQPVNNEDPSILGRIERVFCNGEGFTLKDGTEIKADGKYYAEFEVFDERGESAVKRNGFVSTSYIAKEVIEPENGEVFEYINVPYDVEIKSIEPRHVALVSKPRYEDATIYENQKNNTMDIESKVEIEKGVFISFFSSTADKGKELLSSIFNNSKKKDNMSHEEAKEKLEELEKHEEESIKEKDNSKKKKNNSDEEEKENESEEKENKCNSDEEMENSLDIEGEKVSIEELKNLWKNSKKNNAEEDIKDNSKEESLEEIESKSFNNSKSEKEFIIGISGFGYNNFFNK